MNANATLDDKVMIEELLRRMASRKPGIPTERVKAFIANIGREIERTGGLTKEYVDQLRRIISEPLAIYFSVTGDTVNVEGVGWVE